MKLNALYNAMSRYLWHIEESQAQSLLSVAAMLLEKGDSIVINVDDSVSKPFALSAISGTQHGLDAQHDEGLVAVFPINGPMMKNDTLSGEPGTATMCTWLKQAKENPSVIAGILMVDSPGGQVDGNETFHNEIKAFDAAKPLVTFVNGMMCSAAYEVGCAPKEIIASEKANLIGSIGTMFRALDSKGRLELMGYKVVEAYADASTEKNKAYNDLLKDKPKQMKEEILNPMNELFLQTVKDNRGGRLQADGAGVLSGSVFTAEIAVANGLIDSIGNFDYAMQRARELAGERKMTNNKTQQVMKANSTWNKIIAFLGIKAEDEITDAQMEQMNTELASLETVRAERDQLKTSLITVEAAQQGQIIAAAATETALGVALAEIVTLKAERDQWKQKAEEFGAKDSKEVKEVSGEKDDLDNKHKTELPSDRVQREYFGA